MVGLSLLGVFVVCGSLLWSLPLVGRLELNPSVHSPGLLVVYVQQLACLRSLLHSLPMPLSCGYLLSLGASFAAAGLWPAPLQFAAIGFCRRLCFLYLWLLSISVQCLCSGWPSTIFVFVAAIVFSIDAFVKLFVTSPVEFGLPLVLRTSVLASMVLLARF